MFKNPVTRFLPSAKNSISGVILPNHNWEFPVGSPEWKASYISYRDINTKDDQGHPVVNTPCSYIYVHNRVGPKEDDIVSAKSRERLMMVGESMPDLGDPIIDILDAAKIETSPYHYLTKDGSGKGGFAALSFPSTKCVYNFLGVNAKDAGTPMRQGVLLMPKASYSEFSRLMNIPRMAGQVPVPRDPDWADYLYGDVVNPSRPLEVKTIQRVNPTNEGQRFQSFMFSSNEVSLMGAVNAPVIPVEVLRERLNVFDPDIYNIFTYQQLVDRIVAEGWYPAELVRQACGNRSNIGGSFASGGPNMAPAAAYGSPAPAHSYGAPAGYGGAPYTPPAAYAPPAPSAPPAPPVDEIPMEHKYWCNGAAGVQLMARSEIQTLINSGAGDVMVMAENQVGGWVKASSVGFQTVSAPPVPAAPAPPVAPAPPAAPAPYQPAAAPAAPYQPVSAPAAPYQPAAAESAPWDAPSPAAASASVDPSLASMPYYEELKHLSKRELSALVEEATAKVTCGQLDAEGVARMTTAYALAQ
jgi:hypothetical protein